MERYLCYEIATGFCNHKASEKQLANRAKFRLATKFLHLLFPVMQLGFKNQGKLKSPQNAAMSELMKIPLKANILISRLTWKIWY